MLTSARNAVCFSAGIANPAPAELAGDLALVLARERRLRGFSPGSSTRGRDRF